VKIAEPHEPRTGVPVVIGGVVRARTDSAGDSPEERTRDTVVRLVQQSGPQTAAALAERLALSPAAIRRHLERLVCDGVLTEVTPRQTAGSSRGRGRPARAFALTDAGRSRLGHAYDDLASTALRYLRTAGGDQAVVAFADHRAARLADSIRSRLSAQEFSPSEKAGLVAEVLTEEGYVATVAPAGHGTQLCQHHCPVAHVAAEFPELCEAETRALAEALGTNVQRLATIAHGDGVCTTHIPQPAQPAQIAPSEQARTSNTGGRQ
jgi:predicted ArsR family transcriptional regulator